jgi:hypothetical protein
VWRMLRRWSEFHGHACQIDASCPLTVHSIYDTHRMFLEFPRGLKQHEGQPRIPHQVIYSKGVNMVWGLRVPCEWVGECQAGLQLNQKLFRIPIKIIPDAKHEALNHN